MRKISLGIFSVGTVILFLLSTSVNVTADRELNAVDLDTIVKTGFPYVEASYTLKQTMYGTSVDHYTWYLDVYDGEFIHFYSVCRWLDEYTGDGSPPNSGYHAYLIEGTYNDDINTFEDDDHEVYTYPTTPPTSGQHSIGVTFECYEDDHVDLYFWAYVSNEVEQKSTSVNCWVTVELT